MFWLTFLITMIAATVVDMFWTLYIMYVGQNKMIPAVLSSMAIAACSALIVREYVADSRLIFATIIGAGLGVLLTMKFKAKK